MEGINKIEHKLNSLDFLKIIGVIAICIFHAFYALDKSYEIVQYGRMSAIFVELLFMLSGFFLPNVLINKINFEVVTYDCSSKQGSSGGPIINNSLEIVGVHFGGGETQTREYGGAVPILKVKEFLSNYCLS